MIVAVAILESLLVVFFFREVENVVVYFGLQ